MGIKLPDEKFKIDNHNDNDLFIILKGIYSKYGL